MTTNALILVAMMGMANIAAASLAVYQFPGGVADVTTAANNGTFTPFAKAGGGSVSGSSSDNFIATSWLGTFDPTKYVSFIVTPNSGYALSLSSVSFKSSASGSGPTTGRLSIFLDGSTTAFASFDFVPPNTAISGTASMSSFLWNNGSGLPSLANLQKAEFRFYGSGATNAAGSFRFDDVVLEGSFTAVPEPTNIALTIFICGLISAGGIKQWRNSRCAHRAASRA
jgi:hypothetical protein